MVESTVSRATFYDFISLRLLLLLMPYDGKNPHSTDNTSSHHVNGISELITSAGALLIYLPPYSLDYNPIEEAFPKVKSLIKIMKNS